MPEFYGTYKEIEVGHKTQVVSDVKPAFKGAKVAPWYYAIQYINDEGKNACMLMTETVYKHAVKEEAKKDEPVGKIVKSGSIKASIVLFDEVDGKWIKCTFFANEIKAAKERAAKFPHLCTVYVPKKKGGLFARLFSK